jgi:hypothetical protein
MLRPRARPFRGAGSTLRLAATGAVAMFAAIGMLSGCGRTAAPPAPDRLRYLRHNATRTFGDCAGGIDRCTRITLRWPTVSLAPTDAGRESISAFIRSSLYRSHDGRAALADEDTVMAGFIETYRAFSSQAWATPPAPWRFERRIEPLGDTLGVTCLAVSEQLVLGSAPTVSTTRFTNIDVASGRKLWRADLLRESARDSLDLIGERAFRRVRRFGPDTDIAAGGFRFAGGRFRLNDNVGVTTTGLLFFFNEDEIAPRALGATQISLHWDEVSGFVRPDGPLGRRGP